MSYKKFAYVYDQLMKDAPYDEWIKFTKEIISKYKINPKIIVDLGCGTGSIAIPLSKEGFQVIGVDLSTDMLSIAYEKMMLNNTSFPLLEQDMKDFNLNTTVDLIISYCDSLNYLEGIDALRQTFVQVYKHLKSDGYFIFDMHSPHKITNVFNQTFAWNEEDISVIWLTDVDEVQLSVEHDLTLFVANLDGAYEKIHEVHQQRTYSVDTVVKLLEEVGFKPLDVFGDFSLGPVTEDTERIFYVARK
ncbi:hypothetical protein BHF71_10260 [Vulcanibacillus modesticaldus]|uniref:Methyltransferase domain-containing protein n=1 Tax=Vulcanibacillus modesticaldus TaxID=337097 RepID=A0A1D2YTN2_9BACI|nr:class I SAM-dependent methyltransferase [Vulcanibacillus modesticaldus]OEF99005.1 hypothetical protein BHF71_10260 [Vulcanibacillus modesticaldus]